MRGIYKSCASYGEMMDLDDEQQALLHEIVNAFRKGEGGSEQPRSREVEMAAIDASLLLLAERVMRLEREVEKAEK